MLLSDLREEKYTFASFSSQTKTNQYPSSLVVMFCFSQAAHIFYFLRLKTVFFCATLLLQNMYKKNRESLQAP